MAGKKNPMGKMRPPTKPYLTVRHPGGWEWRVLKAYVSDPNQPFARVHAAVRSPFTSDTGDTYWADIRGEVVQLDPDVPIEALQSHLRPSAEAHRARLAREWDALINGVG